MDQRDCASFIKAEHVEKIVSNNEVSPDANNKDFNDFNEVSPSATDDGTSESWSACKCVFCHKTTFRFEEIRLLECLHSACINCINNQLNNENNEKKSNFRLHNRN